MDRKKLALWLCLLLTLSALSPAALAGDQRGIFATVNNPNPDDRLNLRERPDAAAPAIGKYYSGVVVSVLQEDYIAGWSQVMIGNLQGYMQTRYLTFNASPGSVQSAIPTMIVRNPNPHERLNLRERPSDKSASLGRYYNGTAVEVLGVLGTWMHVRVNGMIGFMMAKYLGDASGASSTRPAGTAIVSNPRPTDRLNLRAKPATNAASRGRYYNGVAVTVLENISADWVRVRIGEGPGAAEGYMQARYLGSPLDGIKSATPFYTAPATLSLRQTANDGGTVIASFEKGTKMTVLAQFTELWWHVQVGTSIGYVKLDAGAIQ